MIDFVTLLFRPVLALVIVIFLFCLWNKHGQKVEAWIKQKFPARGDASAHRSVNVKESRRISRKAAVVVIDFEGERLLIGISDGVLSKLHSVDVAKADARQAKLAAAAPKAPAPAPASPEPAERVAFSAALKSAATNSLSQFIPQRNKLK